MTTGQIQVCLSEIRICIYLYGRHIWHKFWIHELHLNINGYQIQVCIQSLGGLWISDPISGWNPTLVGFPLLAYHVYIAIHIFW